MKFRRILILFLIFIIAMILSLTIFAPTYEGLEQMTKLQRDMNAVMTKMESLLENEDYSDNDRHQTLSHLHNMTFVVSQDISGILNAGTKDQMKSALYYSKHPDGSNNGLYMDISNLTFEINTTVDELPTGIYKTDMKTLQKYIMAVSTDLSAIYNAGTLENQYDVLIQQ